MPASFHSKHEAFMTSIEDGTSNWTSAIICHTEQGFIFSQRSRTCVANDMNLRLNSRFAYSKDRLKFIRDHIIEEPFIPYCFNNVDVMIEIWFQRYYEVLVNPAHFIPNIVCRWHRWAYFLLLIQSKFKLLERRTTRKS